MRTLHCCSTCFPLPPLVPPIQLSAALFFFWHSALRHYTRKVLTFLFLQHYAWHNYSYSLLCFNMIVLGLWFSTKIHPNFFLTLIQYLVALTWKWFYHLLQLNFIVISPLVWTGIYFPMPADFSLFSNVHCENHQYLRKWIVSPSSPLLKNPPTSSYSPPSSPRISSWQFPWRPEIFVLF